MMKLVGILKSRGYSSGQIMSSKSVNGVHSLIGSAGFATAAQNVVTRDRIYAPYLVYKGKAALSAEPIPPKFTKMNSSIRVKRQGIIMLTFSPSIGERKYDWEKKQHFALSAAEVGSLLSIPPTGSCEFFHDPAMKTSNAGQVRKSLSIKGHADGSGYFFSLSVANNLTKTNERFTVPVTSAEFAVMRTSFSFALPYIMGWDRIANQQPAMEESFARSAGPAKAAPSRLDSEWDR